jgi:hypothetical protein
MNNKTFIFFIVIVIILFIFFLGYANQCNWPIKQSEINTYHTILEQTMRHCEATTIIMSWGNLCSDHDILQLSCKFGNYVGISRSRNLSISKVSISIGTQLWYRTKMVLIIYLLFFFLNGYYHIIPSHSTFLYFKNHFCSDHDILHLPTVLLLSLLIYL